MKPYRILIPTFFIALFISTQIFLFSSQNVYGQESQKTPAEQISDLVNQVQILQKQLAEKRSIFVFNRDLKLGDTHPDVYQLQKLLNSAPDTVVARSGIGSSRSETQFFGILTHNAVKKFQEKYASDILYPLGLSKGTGFVGQATRIKLNSFSLVSSLPLPNPFVPTESVNNENEEELEEDENIETEDINPPAGFENWKELFSAINDLMVGFISKYSGLPGDEITLTGSRFTTTGNAVHFGNQYKVSNLNSSGNVLALKVPNIPVGVYEVWISNSLGNSLNKTFFVVVNENSEAPQIDSVSPLDGFYGQEVTIFGKNFTPSGNEVRASYGIVSGLSSPDGKTLKFNIRPFPGEMGSLSPGSSGKEWPIDFYIVNNNGLSEERGVFILKI